MNLAEKRTELRRLEREAKALRREIRKANPAPPKPRAPGATRAERKAGADALELAGKIAARARAKGGELDPRCEWYTNGSRCGCYGSDADHVLGGRWKSDMEALPNGEGFQILCRTHHDIEKHNGAKMPALLQAEEHAIRIGSPGLLRLVKAAIARFNAKHPVAVRMVVSGKGRP